MIVVRRAEYRYIYILFHDEMVDKIIQNKKCVHSLLLA